MAARGWRVCDPGLERGAAGTSESWTTGGRGRPLLSWGEGPQVGGGPYGPDGPCWVFFGAGQLAGIPRENWAPAGGLRRFELSTSSHRALWGPPQSGGGLSLAGSSWPPERREVTEKNRVWNASPPPPPAACQEGIILDYPAVSSHPRGEAAAGDRDPLPGRGLRESQEGGTGKPGQLPTPHPAQTGWGWGRRGCVTSVAMRPGRPCPASLGELRPWGRKSSGPLLARGPAGGAPSSPEALAPWPRGRPPERDSGTCTHTPCHTRRGGPQQVGV